MSRKIKKLKCLVCGKESEHSWVCTKKYKISGKSSTYLPFTCICGADHLAEVDGTKIVLVTESLNIKSVGTICY